MSVSSFFRTIGGRSATVVVNQQYGLHARPGATIAKLTSKSELPIFFTNTNGTNNVRASLLSILQMQIREGSKLKIEVPKNYPDDIFQNVLEVIASRTVDICNKFMSVVELAKF